MKRVKSRMAFTLVEMLIASSIFTIVMGGLGAFMIGAFRMTKRSFALSELSFQIRETRERILFQALPPSNGAVWAGLLSGTNSAKVVEAGAAKILMFVGGSRYSDNSGELVAPAKRNLQLTRREDGKEGVLGNDDGCDGEGWLHPLNAKVIPAAWVDNPTVQDKAFPVTLGGTLEGVSMTNRIVVTRFGAMQPTPSTDNFAKERW